MKKMFTVMCIMLIVATFCTELIAVTNPGYNSNLVPSGIKTKTKNIWSTIVSIVKILSVACVVFAGVRYMFAAPDQKADIKQGLIYLTIGAVLVFGAISIINMVVSAANTVIVK